MSNFIFGIEGLINLMAVELLVLFSSEVIRGFLVGYIVATFIYGFVESSRKHKIKHHFFKGE